LHPADSCYFVFRYIKYIRYPYGSNNYLARINGFLDDYIKVFKKIKRVLPVDLKLSDRLVWAHRSIDSCLNKNVVVREKVVNEPSKIISANIDGNDFKYPQK